jgi:long-chain fatty acid transport protein
MKKNNYWRAASFSAATLIAGAAMTEANAGGFGVREQSTEFQGESFAGAAAGGALSSMFWNPAAAAAKDGINSEASYTFFLPDASIKATGGTLATGQLTGLGGNAAFYDYTPPGANGEQFGHDAWVPASYVNYQINDRLYAGLALNSPFGFAVKPSNLYDGSPLAETTKIFSLDINPNLAFKLTPTLTLGVGLQVEYLHEHVVAGALPGTPGTFGAFGSGSGLRGLVTVATGVDVKGGSVDVANWGVGSMLGAIWTPTATTTLGLGYRSSIDYRLHGGCNGTTLQNLVAGSPGCGAFQTVNGSLQTPDTLTFSIRQDLSDRLTVLGTVEWQGWSKIQPSTSHTNSGAPILFSPVGFNDDWFYSIGAEYKYSPFLTLRAGISYEKSPVTDSNRTVFLPDADRWTPSVGASYKYSDKITVDVAYSHIFLKDAPITQSAGALAALTGSNLLYSGLAQTNVDTFSVGLKYHLGGGFAPLK